MGGVSQNRLNEFTFLRQRLEFPSAGTMAAPSWRDSMLTWADTSSQGPECAGSFQRQLLGLEPASDGVPIGHLSGAQAAPARCPRMSRELAIRGPLYRTARLGSDFRLFRDLQRVVYLDAQVAHSGPELSSAPKGAAPRASSSFATDQRRLCSPHGVGPVFTWVNAGLLDPALEDALHPMNRACGGISSRLN